MLNAYCQLAFILSDSMRQMLYETYTSGRTPQPRGVSELPEVTASKWQIWDWNSYLSSETHVFQSLMKWRSLRRAGGGGAVVNKKRNRVERKSHCQWAAGVTTGAGTKPKVTEHGLRGGPGPDLQLRIPYADCLFSHIVQD